MDNKFSISIDEKDKYTILKLNGGFYGTSSRIFNHKLKEISDKTRFIIIDVSDLFHINSSAIGVLMRTALLLKQNNGDVYIVVIKNNIKSTFKMTGILDVLEIFDSIEMAEKKMKVTAK